MRHTRSIYLNLTMSQNCHRTPPPKSTCRQKICLRLRWRGGGGGTKVEQDSHGTIGLVW